MRIGLLVLSIGNFGNKGFYNLQEIGLAKALASLFEEVLVYRLIGKPEDEKIEGVTGYENVKMFLLPSGQIGSNGIPDFNKIDSSLDILVCFSDTQIMLPSVNRWCKRNNIQLIPYIGVSKSHSNNLIKQMLVDWFFTRNLRVYRKKICLTKTPEVAEILEQLGVDNTQIAPVGLDLDLLKLDYKAITVQELKRKYGFQDNDRIVLFIGRMTNEKQPERMIQIFKRVWEKDHSFRLLMVGKGELSEQVQVCIHEHGLAEKVKRMERIPNKDIWELYRLAECFVNLNQHEIYGMVLLEAMFYGCKVIAWRAPGPNYIIDDGKTGYLTDNDESTCQLILDSKSIGEASREAILSEFTWNKTADVISILARRIKENE